MSAVAAALMAASAAFNLPPGLLSSVCFIESGHRPYIIRPHDGHSDSLGLCQVQLPMARHMGYKGTPESLLRNVNINSFFAAKYLKWQLNRYHGDIYKAVGAYNSGTYYQNKNTGYINKVFDAWLENK